MKRIMLMIFVFVSFHALLPAIAFTIGSGITQDYLTPINSYYDYSWSRSVYTKAEINAAGLNEAGSIVSLGLQTFQIMPDFLMENQSIYMRHTTATTETTPYVGPAGFTLVYSGPIVFFDTGWKIIDLITPFVWNNTDNIEILWENHDGAWQNMPVNFLHHETTENMTVHSYADADFPTGNGSLTISRPNLRLYVDDNTPPEPALITSPPNGQNMTQNLPTLSWASNGGGPTGFKLYFVTTNPPPLVGDLGMVFIWTPGANLPFDTVHYWQVVPYNTHGDAVGCPVWSFTTRSEWETQVGNGSLALPIPILTPYHKTYTQFIYPKEVMNLPHHRISSIAFHWTSEYDNVFSNDVVVYLGNTARDEFASYSDWVPLDSLVIIFAGHLDLSAGDRWISFPVSPSFNYDATKNLVIAVDENTAGGDLPNMGGFFSSMTPNSELVGLLAISTAGDVLPSNPLATADAFNIINSFPNLRLTLTDDIAPTISYLPVLNSPRSDVYIRFEATITDNIGVVDPKLWIAQMPGAVYEPFPLNPGPNDSYWLTYAGIWMGNQYK